MYLTASATYSSFQNSSPPSKTSKCSKKNSPPPNGGSKPHPSRPPATNNHPHRHHPNRHHHQLNSRQNPVACHATIQIAGETAQIQQHLTTHPDQTPEALDRLRQTFDRWRDITINRGERLGTFNQTSTGLPID
jgi:hypothetical protein